MHWSAKNNVGSMPSPYLSNDHGFPHAASTLTCLKSAGPLVPASSRALEALLPNYNSVLRAEPGDQTRFHTCSFCTHPYLLRPFPCLLDQTWAAFLHNTLLMAMEALPISCGDLGSQDQTLTLCWAGSPSSQQPTSHRASSKPLLQQAPESACIPAGIQQVYFTNMRITHECQFLQKSRVSVYASGPPWIPAVW